MRKVIKHIASLILIPLTRWYLRKERKFTYKGTQIIAFPGVFHPGLFSSTAFLLNYLMKLSFEKQSALELGCGTGLISIMLEKSGADVTASDLSKKALENAKHNFELNKISAKLIHSNLFDSIEKKSFDWIIINPPYYAKAVKNEEELAWHCGENFEYFQNLFKSLGYYMHQTTRAIIVLTKGCDLEKIFSIAKQSGFSLKPIAEKKVMFDEEDYLYQIEKLIHLSDSQLK